MLMKQPVDVRGDFKGTGMSCLYFFPPPPSSGSSPRLNNEVAENDDPPYLAGDLLTHADMTWYPTVCFMEYMLPLNFGWTRVFDTVLIGEQHGDEETPFPHLARWFRHMTDHFPEFAAVREGVLGFFGAKDGEGMFEALREEVKTQAGLKWRYGVQDLGPEERERLRGRGSASPRKRRSLTGAF